MFCELVDHPPQAGGEDVDVSVENESTQLEVVAEETVADLSSGQHEVVADLSSRQHEVVADLSSVGQEVVEEPRSLQVHTINIGSEVLSFSCSEQEELILEVPEGMLVETDNGYQIIVSEGK
jgi:L-fucose isomerase-like protein